MGHGAVRDGRWKLVRQFNANRTFVKDHPELTAGFGGRTGTWELYDMENDPNETRDLAAQQPEKAAALVAKYEAWEQRIGVVPRERILKFIPSNHPPAAENTKP